MSTNLEIEIMVKIPIEFEYTPEEIAVTHLAPEDCDPGSPAEIEWWIPESTNLYELVYQQEDDILSQIDKFIKDEIERYKQDKAEFRFENSQH